MQGLKKYCIKFYFYFISPSNFAKKSLSSLYSPQKINHSYCVYELSKKIIYLYMQYDGIKLKEH